MAERRQHSQATPAGEPAMTTERVATRVSGAEMTRRWDAARKLMRERGIRR